MRILRRKEIRHDTKLSANQSRQGISHRVPPLTCLPFPDLEARLSSETRENYAANATGVLH